MAPARSASRRIDSTAPRTTCTRRIHPRTDTTAALDHAKAGTQPITGRPMCSKRDPGPAQMPDRARLRRTSHRRSRVPGALRRAIARALAQVSVSDLVLNRARPEVLDVWLMGPPRRWRKWALVAPPATVRFVLAVSGNASETTPHLVLQVRPQRPFERSASRFMSPSSSSSLARADLS